MLVVETIARIRRDHLVRGVPIKRIARDLRVSKNTVRKVVRGDETSYSYARKIQPMPKLGPWVDELERQLEANEKKPRRDRLSLLRIHEDLAALGYGGGYDAVRRYARTWRRRWRLLSPSQGFVPLSFDPGEAYQFDWSHEYARLSGVTTKVKAAHNRRTGVQVALGHLGDLALAEALDAAELDAHGLALRRGLDGGDEWRLARRASAALGPGTPAAEVGIVHLHPPGERQFGIALEHGLHQFLLDLPGVVWVTPSRRPSSREEIPFFDWVM